MEKKSNQLIVPEGKLSVTKIEKQLGDLIKPLVKDVFLCFTYISRVNFDDVMLKELKVVVGNELLLIREQSRISQLDIAIYTKTNVKLGYVMEKDLPILAHLMDAGKHIYAVVDSINKKEVNVYKHISKVIQVKIKVFLKDI